LLYQHPEAAATLLDKSVIEDMTKFSEIFGDASELRAKNIESVYSVVRALVDKQ
jgi:hypothetical protein